jgi:hypothetical protein
MNCEQEVFGGIEYTPNDIYESPYPDSQGREDDFRREEHYDEYGD